ncbi:MAG TPA: hypothetical protein VD996_16605, partial [Chitinophagaceae bacterium]|nr:hypothetical protein [Chitinophagaceae bacterium]
MKTTGVILLLFLYLYSPAQSVFSNNTNAAIEKVIRDYPNQFRNIRGSVVDESSQAINYQSNITIPGALSCIVTRHNFSKSETITWKAELYESNNFQEAKNLYKDLYSQIRNSIVRIEGEKPYILNGQYEIPDQQKNRHSVIFNMLPSVGNMQKVKVELLMVQHAQTWK